jgi:hypothetical protein
MSREFGFFIFIEWPVFAWPRLGMPSRNHAKAVLIAPASVSRFALIARRYSTEAALNAGVFCHVICHFSFHRGLERPLLGSSFP